MKHQINKLEGQIDVMESCLDTLVTENINQYDMYQDCIHENNNNIQKIREDLGTVQKQHFEMGNINESLEQRIEQLKGQR